MLDASTFCRDAIVVGGSDDAGTTAAVAKLVELLKPAAENLAGTDTAAAEARFAGLLKAPTGTTAERGAETPKQP